MAQEPCRSRGLRSPRTRLIGRGREIFKQWRPDVVVTDLMLPDVDGIELLRRLKEIDPDAEVIVIGGPGHDHARGRGQEAGAFFFLEKPVSRTACSTCWRQGGRPLEERADTSS